MDGPLIDDIVEFMKTRGFRIFDLFGGTVSHDHVLQQIDVGFVNQESAVSEGLILR